MPDMEDGHHVGEDRKMDPVDVAAAAKEKLTDGALIRAEFRHDGAAFREI